ncbi:TPA: hypothetical protein ACK0TB_000973 [Staphylococcus aureus]
MSIQQLDGYISIEDFFKHMDELSKKEELEKKLINQSLNINSILSTQIKRKWCYFYTLF